MRNLQIRSIVIAPVLAILLMHWLGFAQEPPVLDGYITSVTSSTSFAVNGTPVICSARTHHEVEGRNPFEGPWPAGPYLGQPIKIFGRKDGKSHVVNAREIVLQPEAVTAKEGYGVIDRVLSPAAGPHDQIVVRADGYAILIDSKTKSRFTPPLKSLADIATNVWIDFKGVQQLDGHIVATQAIFTSNAVDEREDKLRGKNEYDPAAVGPHDQQGKISKSLLGTQVKRIPPYNDPAAQERIERIGASLIPAYQRALPASDPTRIDFRFSLIDTKWNTVVALPSGIVLVPRFVVERLQNDAQLAAVLASAVALSLEKRVYRDQPAKRVLTAAEFIPDIGIASKAALAVIALHEREQSDRVSLGLLQDAHYDIYQAPVAWWTLASKKPKDLAKIGMPQRSAYLYRTLGSTWRTGQMAVP